MGDLTNRIFKETSFGCFTGDCKHISRATPGGVTRSCLRELVVVEYDVGLGLGEGLGEVGEEVVDVLDADGKADGGFGDVLLGEFVR